MNNFTSFDGDRKEMVDNYLTKEKLVRRLLELYLMALAEGYQYYAEALFMGGLSVISFKKVADDMVNRPVIELLDKAKSIVKAAKDNYESIREVDCELADLLGYNLA